MKLRAGKMVGLVVLALVVAACGGGDGETADSGDSGSSPALKVAYASDLDPNDIADQLGIATTNAEVSALTEDSAVVAGLQNGNFQVGNIDMTAAIKAIQGGVPLKIVYVSQDQPEFVMVSQPEISGLDDLAGKTVAYHSPGSLTEILPRELVRQHDPALEDQIDWTVLPESPNRASAMVAKRIDATSLEFLDVVNLQEQDDFNIIGSWADLGGDSANAAATVWVVSQKYLDENRDAVVEFLSAIQAGYDKFYEDKEAWVAAATEALPDANEEVLGQACDYYAAEEMYPKSGQAPLTEERWMSMDGFFRQIGEYEEEAGLDMVDLEVAAEVSGS
jgi:ABC-type nitrate/sulfonate/bicarbonate transport system substrate-binding protein